MSDTVLDKLDIVKEAVWTTTSVFAVGVGGLLSIIIFARILDPSAVGLYSVGLGFVMFVNSLALGIGFAVKKRSSEENVDRSQFLTSGLLPVVVWLIVSISALFASIPLIVENSEFTSTMILALGLFTAGQSLFTVFKEFVAGVGYPGKAENGEVVRAILMVPFQIGFITLITLGVTGLFAGAGVAYLLGCVLLSIVAFRDANVVIARPTIESLQSLFAFSKWSIVDQFVSTSYRRLDNFVVFIVGTAIAAGYFEVAYTVATATLMFSEGLRKPAYVKLSNMYSKGEDITQRSKDVIGYMPWLGVAVLFGVIFLGDDILGYVFGAEYSQAGTTAAVLCVFMLFFAQRVGLEMYYYVQDRPRVSMWMNVFVVFVFGLLTLIAVGLEAPTEYGVSIIIATVLVLAEASRYTAYIVFIYHETGVVFISKKIGEYFISGGVMALVLTGLLMFEPVTSIFHMIVYIGIGGVVYIGFEYVVWGRSLSQSRTVLA